VTSTWVRSRRGLFHNRRQRFPLVFPPS
jgi:hypothetical protein